MFYAHNVKRKSIIHGIQKHWLLLSTRYSTFITVCCRMYTIFCAWCENRLTSFKAHDIINTVKYIAHGADGM